jgi:hypothetical protein
MEAPLPKAATFAEDLARRIMEEFAGVYYISTETQRRPIIKGIAQLIDCRMQERSSALDNATNPT